MIEGSDWQEEPRKELEVEPNARTVIRTSCP
jgi:hypothetical protein